MIPARLSNKTFLTPIFYIILFVVSGTHPVHSQQEPELPVWKQMHYLSEEEMHIRSWGSRDFSPTPPAVGPIHNVAEFAHMEGVLVRYPFGIPVSMIAEMSEDVIVTTIVANSTQENTVRSLYASQGVNLANCNFLQAPTNSYWTRDYGPWFIIDGNYEVGIVDFPYNRPRPDDDVIPGELADMIDVNLFGMDVVHTGGNYMTDFLGKSASTTLVYYENADPLLQNPPLTPDEVDSLMFAYLGLDTYHVLEDPLTSSIDHIDCWSKFLDVDKVLIGQVPPGAPGYETFEELADYFESQISGWGKPYEVYRVYTPGNYPYTPYTNSLILNDKVFVPQTGSSWDDEAIAVYEEAMPGYEIIGTYAEEAPDWLNTDAIHCRAKGIADREMLWVRHMPYWGEEPPQDSYEVQATVVAMSGNNINPNGVKVFYKVNNGNFMPLVMSTTNDTLFTASIPGADEGDVISYYITASDQSGRTARHPYIGSADPHSFTIQVNYQPDISVSVNQIETFCLAGSSSDETFFIYNTGNMQLNYSIQANTVSYEYYPYDLPDSPDPNAFISNTYTELGWTEIYVGEDAVISQWKMSFTWFTLYPGLVNGGSYWVESPSGTIAQISGNLSPGNYTVTLNAFNGENMMGTWKIWIQDSFSQGGHQATGITMTLRKTIDPGQWLTTVPTMGAINAGGQKQVTVTCDASQLDPGTYTGQLTITSNDPDEPSVVIPVTFTVGGLPYVEVSPDSLIFLDHIQMIEGQDVTIKNPTEQNIMITAIDHEGFNPFYWYIEPWNITLPYLLTGGDSLVLTVKIALPVTSPDGEMWYDTLNIQTENDFHQVLIGVDSDLISGTGPDMPESFTLNISPNPFSSSVHIHLHLPESTYLKAQVFDLTGNPVFTLTETDFRSGIHTLTWNGCNDSGRILPQGVYVLRVSSKDGTLTEKLMLVH